LLFECDSGPGTAIALEGELAGVALRAREERGRRGGRRSRGGRVWRECEAGQRQRECERG
jgi:hypothetical protein